MMYIRRHNTVYIQTWFCSKQKETSSLAKIKLLSRKGNKYSVTQTQYKTIQDNNYCKGKLLI